MPKANALSPEGVKLVQEPQLAHFVTLMSDGSPQVTPVWVDVSDDGTEILINTADGRQKTENILRNPEVAVSVVDAKQPFRWLSLRGTATLRHEGADDHIDAMAKKYLGVERYPGHTANEQRVIVVIKPHHVVEQVSGQ